MYKVLPARYMKRVKAIQDMITKETNKPTVAIRSSPFGTTTKFMNTAKNVIFPSDAAVNEETVVDQDLAMGKIEKLREELDDIVASECVLCGDIMIKSIDQPFIGDEELDVATSWAI
jgi:hypothetical protein